jgi:hypothetical protein
VLFHNRSLFHHETLSRFRHPPSCIRTTTKVLESWQTRESLLILIRNYIRRYLGAGAVATKMSVEQVELDSIQSHLAVIDMIESIESVTTSYSKQDKPLSRNAGPPIYLIPDAASPRSTTSSTDTTHLMCGSCDETYVHTILIYICVCVHGVRIINTCPP